MYGLGHRPHLLTVVSITESEYCRQMAHFETLAARPEEDPVEQEYAGLGPRAVEVLMQQARRGGPEVALGRLMQGQNKSIRVLALISDDATGRPLRAIHFDLAGAHPTSDALDLETFAEDAGRRILTAMCAEDAKEQEILPEPLSLALWKTLSSPQAMNAAGRAFTRFGFFTDPIAIEKILGFRGGIGEAIAAQYSEGCYAVFEPQVGGLITTATGSSKFVDKRFISRDDQAIVAGIKPARDGALVRQIEGRPTVLPSVEAVEMMSICEAVAYADPATVGEATRSSSARAILHGHLGVSAYDPRFVEAVTLEEPFYQYLVSCGTGALAEGTSRAFARSNTLRDPADPRRVVFLEQPGHGVVIVEKRDENQPFSSIRDSLDNGLLRMSMRVPQGAIQWSPQPGPDGAPVLHKA